MIQVKPRNRSCLVKAHRAGLFSNINKVISTMRIYDNVGVDWSEGCVYGNCWDKLFSPAPPPHDPMDVIYDYPIYDITAACAGILYQNPCWMWRPVFHGLWDRLQVNPEITSKANALVAPGSDVVAAMVRSHIHAGEQLSNRSQPIEEYARTYESSRGPGTSLFIMASDDETVDWFKARFNCIVFPGVSRARTRDSAELHLSTQQGHTDAENCLIEVIAASNCAKLIHPISNMATAALYINTKLESIYIR
jgi:hypothetical protein